MGVPVVRPCPCQIAEDLIRNLNRGWGGLSSAQRLEGSSPLLDHVTSNLYITASDEDLRIHLRNTGLRMGPSWAFKVVSDADLMTAWLSTAAMVGKEILDPDSASVSSEKATLVDLIHPPGLLIVRLGVKSARNSAMGEVFLETLQHREYTSRQIWVVDQPDKRYDTSHLSYSPEALSALRGFPYLSLSKAKAKSTFSISDSLSNSLPTTTKLDPIPQGTPEPSSESEDLEEHESGVTPILGPGETTTNWSANRKILDLYSGSSKPKKDVKRKSRFK